KLAAEFTWPTLSKHKVPWPHVTRSLDIDFTAVKSAYSWQGENFCNQTFHFVKSLAKPVLLGIVWSASVLLLPLVFIQQNIEFGNWMAFSTLTLLFFINGNLFDYRDKLGDRLHGKANLANYLTDKHFQQMLVCLSLLAFLLSLVAEQFLSLTWISIYLLAFNLLSYLYPNLCKTRQELFYDYYIDFPFLLFPLVEVLL
ncbi:MAG: hypothetical protein AAF518_18015, partial [Spirochaetota bacterium]